MRPWDDRQPVLTRIELAGASFRKSSNIGGETHAARPSAAGANLASAERCRGPSGLARAAPWGQIGKVMQHQRQRSIEATVTGPATIFSDTIFLFAKWVSQARQSSAHLSNEPRVIGPSPNSSSASSLFTIMVRSTLSMHTQIITSSLLFMPYSLVTSNFFIRP